MRVSIGNKDVISVWNNLNSSITPGANVDFFMINGCDGCLGDVKQQCMETTFDLKSFDIIG